MSYNKLFKNWKKDYLVEARIDKIKKRYKGNDEVIEKLSDGDPSGNDKYLGWMAKQVVKNDKNPDDVIDVTQSFHENKQRLDNKDIYQWKFDDLKSKLDSLGKSKRQKKLDIKDQTIKIYEDDEYLFIAPLSTEASCVYGAGTRWCISGRENNMFNQYARDQKVNFVFIFMKNKPEDQEWSKIALCYYPKDLMRKLADKIYDSGEAPDFFTSGRSLGSYQGKGREAIYSEIIKNPQEIYNATDDLVCNVEIPSSLEYDRSAVPHGLGGMRNANYPSCGPKLDEILNGQWYSKFQDIVYRAIGKVREGITGQKNLEAEEAAKILDEMRKVTETGENPWRNFKLVQNKEYLGASFVSVRTDSVLLHRMGLRDYNDGEGFLLDNIRAEMNIDWRYLGLKPVEYTEQEQFVLGAYYFGGTAQRALEILDAIDKHKDNPEAMEAVRSVHLRKFREMHLPIYSRLIRGGLRDYLYNEMPDINDWPNISYHPEQELVDGYIMDSTYTEGKFVIQFDAYNLDDYYLNWKYTKNLDNNMNEFITQCVAAITERAEELVEKRHRRQMESLGFYKDYYLFEGVV